MQTDVIGFSQTAQWARFTNWHNAAKGGGSVERWAGTTRRMTEFWLNRLWSGIDPNAARVIFNISSNELDDGDSPQEWADVITIALYEVADRYNAVDEVVLEPVVGGDCPGIRASQNHPVIDDAIALLVGSDEFPFTVQAGLSPEVASCDQFSDSKGHLTTPGARYVADQMMAFHGD